MIRTPARLEPLIELQVIDEVLSQLQSGKEAEVYIVRRGDEICCAKVYKQANNRSFKQKAQYTEGRQVRNSRQARAMNKKSKYGREEDEAEWLNAEVEALYALSEAGVRVPKPYGLFEGVLLLEMIADRDGHVAPRLDNVTLSPEKALEYYEFLVRQAVLMLCAGYVHGDYTQFNILVGSSGPVIIDFPQAVQATAQNAGMLFERDLNQLTAFFARFAPSISQTRYAKEIWKLYSNGRLKPSSTLTGQFQESTRKADIRAVLAEVEDAKADEMARREWKAKKD